MSAESVIGRQIPLGIDRAKERIENLGGTFRSVTDERGLLDFDLLYRASLLGWILRERPENCLPESSMTGKERELFGRIERGETPKIKLLFDVDGVLVCPSRVLHEGENKIQLSTFRQLFKLTQFSDNLTVDLWTSRLNLGSLGKLLHFRPVSRFPFFDDISVKRMEEFGRGNLSVHTNKPIFSGEAADQLAQFINQSGAEMVMYVGSGLRDWKLAENYFRRYRKDTFIYFYTGNKGFF